MRIGIRPGVNILAVLRHLEYKPWYALAEYVDNALDSYLSIRQELQPDARLRVSIEIDRLDKIIVIRDNAGGIARSQIPRAFRAAEPPENASGLSQFGMGMKSASCWFAPIWEVRTSALGEDVERRIRFDIDHIVQDRLEEINISTLPADPASHYTVITLFNVFQVPQGRTLAKIRDHLADIYRCFIRDGILELALPGGSPGLANTPLTYDPPELLSAPRYSPDNEPHGAPIQWKKSVAFELPDGRLVCGHAGLLARGDTRRAGLCLFRRNRAIVGTGDEKYRPVEIFGSGNTYESQRLWGELHMDDFDVSHTKDGFRWGTAEDAFLEALRASLDDEPMPLLKQARNYRSGRPSGTSTDTAATAAVAGVEAALVTHGGPDFERVTAIRTPAAPPPGNLLPSVGPLVAGRTFAIHAAGGNWNVSVQIAADENATDWLTIACDQSEAHRLRTVDLRVQINSPFMRRVVRLDSPDSIEPVLRLAAAIGLAEVLARFGGIPCGPGEVRRNMNELLRSSLSQRQD